MYDFTRFIRKKVQAWGHKISPGLVPAYMPMHHAWNLTSQLNCCTIKNSRSSFNRRRKLHWHRCQVGFSKTGSRNLHYLIHVANSRNLRHRLEKWESWKVEATFVALTRPKLSHRTLGSHRTYCRHTIVKYVLDIHGFAKLNFEDYPFNEYGDVIEFNYKQFINSKRYPLFHVEESRVSKLSDRVSKNIDPSLFVGFIDFEVTSLRFPR